jgi:hypothetical protein
MKYAAETTTPISVRALSNIETLPDEIDKITQLARAECDVHDQTQRELLDALTIAWLAAERWRIERSDSAMRRINEH